MVQERSLEALALRCATVLSAADMTDDVARAAAGDVSAFERVYHAHLPRVHSLVRRMAGGHDTDELTQDVFVRVWQKLGSFRGDAAFSTWLHRLAVNVVIERFRAERARRLRLRDGDDIFETIAAPMRSRDLSMDFETALTALPDGAREIFVLHDVEGYKHREIASLLDISAGTSKAQLHRARMMLRRQLRPGGT
jgi:RNA polymerase sigma-70 factor (ECF subfamily)